MRRSSHLALRGASAVALGLALGLLAVSAARRRGRLDLRGRVAIVTGGSRGLGLLLAEELGRRGARVAICGRDLAAVEEASRRLGRLGIDVLALACDLGDRADAEAFVHRVHTAWGRLDVVVNNAGLIQVAPVAAVTHEGFEEAVRSNFWSAVHVTFAALPLLAHSDSAGRLVNVVSLAGRVATPHLLGYSASKFALLGFSEGLATELRHSGILVTTVVPGPLRTGSIYNAEFSGKSRREFEWFSVVSSLPVVSADARRAARRVVRAIVTGRPHVTVGALAFALGLLHGVAPGLTVRVMALLDAMLPPGGADGEVWRGREIGTPLQRSALLHGVNRAALSNNEEPPDQAR